MRKPPLPLRERAPFEFFGVNAPGRSWQESWVRGMKLFPKHLTGCSTYAKIHVLRDSQTDIISRGQAAKCSNNALLNHRSTTKIITRPRNQCRYAGNTGTFVCSSHPTDISTHVFSFHPCFVHRAQAMPSVSADASSLRDDLYCCGPTLYTEIRIASIGDWAVQYQKH